VFPVRADAVQLNQAVGALLKAVWPLHQQESPAHAVEVVRKFMNILEFDGVEDGELGRPLIPVVTVAQERRDVTLDKIILDLTLEEHLVDQVVHPQVQIAFREEDVQARKKGLLTHLGRFTAPLDGWRGGRLRVLSAGSSSPEGLQAKPKKDESREPDS